MAFLHAFLFLACVGCAVQPDIGEGEGAVKTLLLGALDDLRDGLLQRIGGDQRNGDLLGEGDIAERLGGLHFQNGDILVIRLAVVDDGTLAEDGASLEGKHFVVDGFGHGGAPF